MTSRIDTRTTSPAARRGGYVVSVVVNVVLLYVINVGPGWQQLQFLTAGFADVLAIVNLSMLATLVVNVVQIFYDPQWFYDSPLPSRFASGVLEQHTAPETSAKDSAEQDRKSFLATPLFLDADFWINLPAYSDHPVLGVNGALVNATLWNASNTQRFFRSAANAPAAVAEMAAIPELRERWVLNVVSLERYQFIGGPFFNSLYTVSEKKLWMSADPVLLDMLMLDRINAHRVATGFRPVLVEDRRLLDYAEQLGVGTTKTAETKWRRP